MPAPDGLSEPAADPDAHAESAPSGDIKKKLTRGGILVGVLILVAVRLADYVFVRWRR